MGNCMFSGLKDPAEDAMVRVVTNSGGVMELHTPVTAECITNGFPGHGIFRSADPHSTPLLHNEELLGGKVYYLRPLGARGTHAAGLSSIVASYRVSFDHHGHWKRQQEAEGFPRCTGGNLGVSANGGALGGSAGVWKVKLVISPAQLADILSHDSRTEALIESMRTVAKCGNGVAASVANSDQWSLASSRKAFSDSAV
ncbi:hypothetical protein Taro_035423 [Colocasia esculenta]|uniref:Uncharacterized protein n=1 Tax=Colocasia esculenta TaxID=4460 RepID=A0A843W3S2_COLES|nr:hypothetical protein [Colocasia esculenta]